MTDIKITVRDVIWIGIGKDYVQANLILDKVNRNDEDIVKAITKLKGDTITIND